MFYYKYNDSTFLIFHNFYDHGTLFLRLTFSAWYWQNTWRNTPQKKLFGNTRTSSHHPASPVWVTFLKTRLRIWSYNLWPVLCVYIPPAWSLHSAVHRQSFVNLCFIWLFSLSLKFSFSFVNFWICDWRGYFLFSFQFILFWLSFLYIFYLCFLTWIICSIIFLQKRIVNWKKAVY